MSHPIRLELDYVIYHNGNRIMVCQMPEAKPGLIAITANLMREKFTADELRGVAQAFAWLANRLEETTQVNDAQKSQSLDQPIDHPECESR